MRVKSSSRRGATAADQFQIARRRQDDMRIEINDGCDFRERMERMPGVELGAEQAFFFRRPRGKNNRARRRFSRFEGARDLEDFRSAGGVIDRAVADAVAGFVGPILPVRIPMRAVENEFVGPLRAFDLGEDVAAVEGSRFEFAADGSRGFGERERAESRDPARAFLDQPACARFSRRAPWRRRS